MNKSAFGGPPACGKCHKPPFSPCMYNHVPDPGPKICPCKCHQVDVSIAKVDQTTGDIKIKPGVESKTKPEVDVGMEEKAEVKQARCDCQWLPWLHKCYGHCLKTVKPVPAQLVDFPSAKVDQTADDINIKPRGEVSIAEDAEVVESKTRSAADIFMEEKLEKKKAMKKMLAKLALLEREVTLGEQLLLQAKTLRQSKEALLHKKVRVKYYKYHKLWRGKVISAHKSSVDEQVNAAKARLGLRTSCNQFNIPAMVNTIDKLAPGGCYKSAKPLPLSTSTSRTGVRPTSAPRRTTSSRFMVPPPPISYSVPAKKSSHAPAAVPQTSSGIGGDQCIVSFGDVLDEEPCYDIFTQLEFCAEEYLWDGEYDFSCCIEEELEVDNSAIIWDDAKELEVEACYYNDEVATCFDAEEEVCYSGDAEMEDRVCYSDAEVEDCYYLCHEDYYDY